MRILFIHPNYHSGGADIAGTWTPAWIAYLAGPLKAAGFDDIHFIDAMTMNVTPEALRQTACCGAGDPACRFTISPRSPDVPDSRM